jgi:hypothetical protein
MRIGKAHVPIAPIGLAAVLLAAMIAMDGKDGASALVSEGEVVSTTQLWKGTTETSINGKRLRAELHVELGATSTDPPQAVLINTGEHNFGYGNGFRLDRLSRGFWEPVEDQSLVTLELNGLSPGGRSGPMILDVLPKNPGPSRLLPSGEYRITKDFEIDSGDPHQARPFEVSARFIVE